MARQLDGFARGIGTGARDTVTRLGATDGKLTNFLADKGMVSTDNLYPAQKDAISPRVGITYVPWDNRKTVFRGGYGLFYDMFAVAFFTANTGFANGGALGVGNNPGGDQPVFSITQRRLTVGNGVPIFGTASQPPYGAFAVSQDLKLPYVENFNVNVEQQIGPTTIAQVGYVGTRGHRLALMRDINARDAGRHRWRSRVGRSPRCIRIWRRSTSSSRSDARLQLAADVADSERMARRFGRSELHAVARDGQRLGGAQHVADHPEQHRRRLGQRGVRHPPRVDRRVHLQHPGASGRRGSATAGRSTPSRRSRAARRSRLRPAPTPAAPASARIVRISSAIRTRASSSRRHAAVAAVVQSGRVRAAGARHVRQPRAQRLYGPGFKSVDLSVFKTTKLSGSASMQLRLEVFNLFNTINWANPGASVSASTSFGVITNTRNANNAPGIGAGEPRNVQLAAKIISDLPVGTLWLCVPGDSPAPR